MSDLKLFCALCGILFAANVFAWEGPQEGPVAQAGKKIIFIASDLKNGGVLGVKRGFLEAVRELSWEVEIKDGAGDLGELRNLVKEALHSKVDGIVLGGFQPDSSLESLAQSSRVVMVGWHAGPHPGRTKMLFANVTTDPSEVARLAADSALRVGSKSPGVVIISDNQFAIANEKVKQITDTLKKCKHCRVLSVENVAISDAQHEISSLVSRLQHKFGKEWTHTIAINDIYFDNMNFPLKEIGRNDVANIAAGDGSRVALSRIKGGGSQQVVTVAEPLLAQGWQLADELNRAFSRKKESGFVSKPLTVTKEVLDRVANDDIESHGSFRETYSNIWKRR